MIEEIISIAEDFENCVTIVEMESPLHPLIYVNKKFCQVTGFSEQQSLGRNCKFLQGEYSDPTKIKFMRESFLAESACCVDLVNYKKCGQIFWNRLVMFPVREEGKLYYVGLQNDITEQKRKSGQEVDLTRIKDSEICHKIKNPLAIALGMKELIDINRSSIQSVADLKKSIRQAIERIDHFVINLEQASEFEAFSY